MVDQAEIEQLIKQHYPSLEKKYKRLLSKPSFDTLKIQLQWATDENELKRALHRLHCFIMAVLGELESSFPSIDAHFSKLNETHKQALVALIAIDSCKCSGDAISAFERNKEGRKAKKDSVVFFFETLMVAPEIYPIFQAISDEAQDYIRNNIFYLHQRHLLFGEVPTASLHTFANMLNEKPSNETHIKLKLQNHFWLANLMGFDLPMVGDHLPMETAGPTMTSDRLSELEAIQAVLFNCVEETSLNPLNAHYYAKLRARFPKLIPVLANKKSNDNLKIFIGRLSMLLCDKLANSEVETILLQLLNNDDNYELLISTEESEAKVFNQLELTAVTFLPRLFWSLIVAQDLEHPNLDSVILFLKLQKAIYIALPEAKDSLQGEPSVPMFSLSIDQDFLSHFIQHPDYQLKLEITIGPFVTLKANLRAQPAASYAGVSSSHFDTAAGEKKEKMHAGTDAPSKISPRKG